MFLSRLASGTVLKIKPSICPITFCHVRFSDFDGKPLETVVDLTADPNAEVRTFADDFYDSLD
jgi:hypothetical protein